MRTARLRLVKILTVMVPQRRLGFCSANWGQERRLELLPALHREGSGAWLSAAFGRGFCDATYDSSESGIGCGAAERESSSSRQTSTRVSQDQVGFARALDVFWQRNPTG